MTYFGVLIPFVIAPMLLLLFWSAQDVWQGLRRRNRGAVWQPYLVILMHVGLALFYTTPWDNYLVATGVWWYDPDLVIGIRLGWVPVEEYLFFIVQTMLTGFWALNLMRLKWLRAASPVRSNLPVRMKAFLFVGSAWLVSTAALLAGWKSGTYLTLILSWALIPIMVQLLFGADILFANWRLVGLIVLPITFYLWLVDALAIRSGTWTIDPAQTMGIDVGVLPLEEMIFFFMTNVIIGFGLVLMLSPDGQARVKVWREKILAHNVFKAMFDDLSRAPAVLLWMGIFLIWWFILVFTPIVMWIAGDEYFSIMIVLGVVTQFIVSVSALSFHWPFRRLALVTLFAIGLTWLAELLGQTTAFPFGRYIYTSILQPQILGVPLLIPFAWLMMLIPAWGMAEAILLFWREKLGRGYPIAFAGLAGLAFTAWDLYLDPQMVARSLWVWDSPGAYFGIPWQNYVGWWLTSMVITIIVRPYNLPRFALFAVYTSTWIFQAIGLGLFWGQPAPAIIGFLGMGGFVAIAWMREGQEWISHFGRWLDSYRVQSHIQ